jgi:hypothetical protein
MNSRSKTPLLACAPTDNVSDCLELLISRLMMVQTIQQQQQQTPPLLSMATPGQPQKQIQIMDSNLNGAGGSGKHKQTHPNTPANMMIMMMMS